MTFTVSYVFNVVFAAHLFSVFFVTGVQVAVLAARLEGKDLELESIKDDNGDMLQKVGGAAAGVQSGGGVIREGRRVVTCSIGFGSLS